MFDLIIHEELTDRQLLLHIAKELKAMALDISKLTANAAKLSTDVDALLAAHTDPAAQVAVDAAAATLADLSTKIEAVVQPAPSPAA